MRHAKSSWSNLKLTDLQRPLNARGRHDAPLMGQALAKVTVAIDEIILSPSIRTKETSVNIKKYVNFSSERIVDRLYHASIEDISNVVSMIADSVDSILLIGHNPGLTYFYNLYATDKIENLHTCGLDHIRLNADKWSEMDTTNARVEFLKYPKMYY